MLHFDPERPVTEPKDAATIVLLRDGEYGVEVLLVKRHSKSAFLGGAHVFPGGKLDDADTLETVARRCRIDARANLMTRLGEPALEASRALGLFVAAARETFEEAGLLLSSTPLHGLEVARRALLDGERTFAQALTDLDVELDLEALEPFARWITPTQEARRFDARFFMARAPDGQVAAHDRRETTDSAWYTPAAALSAWERGQIELAPPTSRTLENLRDFNSVSAALTAARAQPVRAACPEVVRSGDTIMLVMPGDPLHSESELAVPGPSRFVLRDRRFVSETPATT